MPLVAGKSYVFYNKKAGTALDLDVSSGNVQGWTYHGGPNQQWKVSNGLHSGGIRWLIQNVQKGYYLSFQTPAQNGRRVTCTPASAPTEWTISSESGNEVYKISDSFIPGQCIDLADGGKSADGTPVQMWSSSGGDNQKWEARQV